MGEQRHFGVVWARRPSPDPRQVSILKAAFAFLFLNPIFGYYGSPNLFDVPSYSRYLLVGQVGSD